MRIKSLGHNLHLTNYKHSYGYWVEYKCSKCNELFYVMTDSGLALNKASYPYQCYPEDKFILWKEYSLSTLDKQPGLSCDEYMIKDIIE